MVVAAEVDPNRSSPAVWPSGMPPLARITRRDGSLSAAHVSRTRARPRSRHCASPAASIRVAWPLATPRRHGVVPDVAAHLDQFRGELMADDQGAQVVLAGDVPEDGGRHVPADLHSAPDGDEALEVVAGSFQPLRRGAAQQAVGLLSHQVRHPDFPGWPHQPRRFDETDHRASLPSPRIGCHAEYVPRAGRR